MTVARELTRALKTWRLVNRCTSQKDEEAGTLAVTQLATAEQEC